MPAAVELVLKAELTGGRSHLAPWSHRCAPLVWTGPVLDQGSDRAWALELAPAAPDY